MPSPLHTKIRSALANPGLQAALDTNAERRSQAVSSAMASLPEGWAVMRQRAHSDRAQTIAHLDQYLQAFITKVQANGIVVHLARDATEAVQIVAELATQNSARLVAKSKSMVSEEINLNHALEAVGVKVVETDLGEFIVQLRGEKPAHIVTPAVHLRREDVGLTFEERLGLPFTDDIAVMTAAARKFLREVFLNAEIGISGVNFGVVETGTLCLVTNEGNGRMVTTLPPVHIAVMGLERLVPSLDDLALMLALLPRAATGQKLSVYTSLIHKPRQPGDPDGPQQRHLVLVDNGRRAMRNSPLAEALLCIRCGACLNACPVYREIGGHAYVDTGGQGSTYPGPIGSIVSPGLFGQAEFGQLARASSLCGACRDACPVAIDLPKLLLRVRAGGLKLEPREALQNVPASIALGLRLYTWFSSSPWRFRQAQRLLRLAAGFFTPLSGWLKLPAFTGWGYSKDFPRPRGRPFRARWTAQEAAPSISHGELAVRGSIPGQIDEAALPAAPREATLLVDQFRRELEALGAAFNLCREEQLAHLIVNLLDERKLDRVFAWEADHLPAGLLEHIRADGIEVVHNADTSIKAGLTGALAGIADTGSLVLPGGPGRPLAASLLPELHLAVVFEREIKENLPQVFKLPEVRAASSVALVTGPSRTADIEMTLTIGVHGPGEVHVFCLQES